MQNSLHQSHPENINYINILHFEGHVIWMNPDLPDKYLRASNCNHISLTWSCIDHASSSLLDIEVDEVFESRLLLTAMTFSSHSNPLFPIRLLLHSFLHCNRLIFVAWTYRI